MAPRQDYDKIIKLACKPKNAPPKAKYLDALIAATWDESTLPDITRALSLRLKDSNPVVVFKALLTLHHLLRAGSAENLLSHCARSDALRLRNVQVAAEGSGYRPPSNLAAYAYYLDARIRTFREIKRDLVFSQTESNRRSTGLSANSKARRLRHLPVEKGLLREVKQVQRCLDALVRCTFYDDDLHDENTVLAYRMLVKDLLVLFQAGNEGVCNILEHYFEMSKVDATDSFEIYKSFIKQTDKIVDYLAIARRLNNVVNVPVPNLKHAPTSLVKALEEYLNDPNFEDNRLEYKRSLGVVEGKGGASGSSAPAAKTESKAEDKDQPAAASSSEPKASASTSTPAPAGATQQKIQDFLDSIQADAQPTIFGGAPSPTSPGNAGMGQMGQMGQMGNPMGQQMGQMGQGMGQQMGPGQMGQFGHMGQMGQMGQMGHMGHMGQSPFGTVGPMQMQMTGNPFRQSTMMFPQQTGFPQQGGFLQPQATGFLQPQQTGAMAFHPQRSSTLPSALPSTMMTGMDQFGQFTQQPQQPQHQNSLLSPSSTLQPQMTGFLQPQTTGSNPFRQSMMLGSMGPSGALSQPVTPAFGTRSASPPSLQPVRSGSTPATTSGTSGFASSPKPLTAQKTGSNNPFAPPGGIPTPAPPVPKAPTMNELAHNFHQQQFALAGGLNPQPAGSSHASHPAQAQAPQSSPWDPFGPSTNAGSNTNTNTGAANANGSAMSDVASAFATDPKPPANDFFSQFASLNLSSNSQPQQQQQQQQQQQASSPGGFLQPQRTGFGGSAVKPFQPTSSFGSSLMETLPPIPEPDANANSSSRPAVGALGGLSAFGSVVASPTGSSQGQPNSATTGGFLQPSGTGASGSGMAQNHPNLTGGGFQPSSSFGQTLVAQHTGQPGLMRANSTGGSVSNPFRASLMPGAGAAAGPFGANSPFAGQNLGGSAFGAGGMGGGMGAGMGGAGMGQAGSLGGQAFGYTQPQRQASLF